MKRTHWLTRVDLLRDEVSSSDLSIFRSFLISDGNCDATRTIEIGMQIMSHSPMKVCDPMLLPESGCNATVIAGTTQIKA